METRMIISELVQIKNFFCTTFNILTHLFSRKSTLRKSAVMAAKSYFGVQGRFHP